MTILDPLISFFDDNAKYWIFALLGAFAFGIYVILNIMVQ